MDRFILILLLSVAIALPDPASGGPSPVPWRDGSDTPASGCQTAETQPSPEILTVDRISAYLADGEKPPARGFDEQVEPVVQVGLTPAEQKYLRRQPSEAFLRSVALPGWGQRYGERNLRGAIFTGIEAGLWTGLLLTRQTWIEGQKDYKTFARQHAGITGDPDHQFYVDMGNYNNLDQFNAAQRAQRQFADLYRGSGYYWEWDSPRNRRKFKDIRIEADQAKNRIYYFVGGMVLNRVLSAIDASRGLSKRQKDLQEKQSSMSFNIGFDPKTNGPSLVWSW